MNDVDLIHLRRASRTVLTNSSQPVPLYSMAMHLGNATTFDQILVADVVPTPGHCMQVHLERKDVEAAQAQIKALVAAEGFDIDILVVRAFCTQCLTRV